MNDAAKHEYAIIGSMLTDVQCAERGLAECEPVDFANLHCLRVFKAMQALKASGRPIDLVTVGTLCEDEHIHALLEIVGCEAYLPANFPVYVDLAKEARKRREFRGGLLECFRMIDDENDGAYQAAQDLLYRVNAIGGGGVQTVAATADEAVSEMGERVVGEPTGFCDLDKHIGGLIKGSLIVVAGRPSMGKSSLAVNIAQHLCEVGKTVAVFSMEDDEKAIVRRMVCAKARVSFADVRTGDIAKINAALRAKEQIKGYKLYVCDRGVQTTQSIASDCYKIKQREHGLDLVVVDYIGLIKTRERPNSTRQQEIGEITRAMKLLAKELNCSVMLVSQLNRGLEARSNKKPMMSDLRESGDIEQDADVILFPFRPWVYDRKRPQTEAQLIIAKNRNGAIGEIELNWRGEWFLFESAAMPADGFTDVGGAEIPEVWANEQMALV